MSSPTDQIYDLKDSPPPAPRQPVIQTVTITKLQRQLPPSAMKRLHRFAKALTWVMVGIFLIGGGIWAFKAGMDVRRDIWQSTRSIRFKDDICRGFMFGNDALRFAENRADLQQKADALADQSPAVLRAPG